MSGKFRNHPTFFGWTVTYNYLILFYYTSKFTMNYTQIKYYKLKLYNLLIRSVKTHFFDMIGCFFFYFSIIYAFKVNLFEEK